MRTVNGTLIFILAIFSDLSESAWPHKVTAVHPLPIQIEVRHYESYSHRGHVYALMAGPYLVVTDDDKKYIIGVIRYNSACCPLMIPKTNHPLDYAEHLDPNNYVKVKVRIDGNIANVTVPISNEDPLNNRFFRLVDSAQLIDAEIR